MHQSSKPPSHAQKTTPKRYVGNTIDPRQQSPRENVADMIFGFFDGRMLTKDEVRQIINDALEYSGRSENDSSQDSGAVALTVHVEEEVTQGTLSTCFIHACIAETIIKQLGDMEFARQVYKRSEELAFGIDDLQCLAGSIRQNLKDMAWYNRLRAKAKDMKSL